MSEIWLIIWRFQPLHVGHLLLIETSLKETPATLVLIGSINKCDKGNPYSYELRREMILWEINDSKLSLWWLSDTPNDKEWVKQLISYIPKQVSVCKLYCGDKKLDSAVQSLLALKDTLDFQIEIIEIPRSIVSVSATDVRKWIQEKNHSKLNKYLKKNTLKILKEAS